MSYRTVVLSVLSVFVILVGVTVMWTGVEAPTEASRDDLLKAHELPADLPVVIDPGRNADAAEPYQQAIAYYQGNRAQLKSGQVAEQHAKKLTELLIEGLRRANVSYGFLDDQVPLQPGEDPEYGAALSRIPQIVGQRARQQEPEAAERSVRALWAFGRRLFEQNVRLPPRRSGLDAMFTAINAARSALGEDSELTGKLAEYEQPIRRIHQAWQQKIRGIYSMQASAGDLIRIANRDADKGFRIAALLRLGVVQYMTSSSRNQAAMVDCLKKHADSDDPKIARAAQAARAFTREQVRMLN